MTRERPILEVLRLGRTRYEDAHAEQLRILAGRIAGELSDHLVLTEHDPVVTLGRGSDRSALPSVPFPVLEVERGGEATYHGPGQVVAYPIVALDPERRDLHRYLRDLEEVVLRVLAEFEVEGARRPGLTGVWIGPRKVCSIGVAVRRWVAWHGLALNVHTDLEAFRAFRPCGLDPDLMTRLVDHADLAPGNLLVELLLVKHFCSVFDFELPPPPADPPASPGGAPRFPELPILPG